MTADVLTLTCADCGAEGQWLSRWAYVPPRAAATSGLTSCEWMA